jgi:ATP-dependent helicase HrpA
MHQINIEKVQHHYQQCLSKINPTQPTPSELLEVRWMIEELRISFFAQQLGTAIPISVKRIENHLASF